MVEDPTPDGLLLVGECLLGARHLDEARLDGLLALGGVDRGGGDEREDDEVDRRLDTEVDRPPTTDAHGQEDREPNEARDDGVRGGVPEGTAQGYAGRAPAANEQCGDDTADGDADEVREEQPQVRRDEGQPEGKVGRGADERAEEGDHDREPHQEPEERTPHSVGDDPACQFVQTRHGAHATA